MTDFSIKNSLNLASYELKVSRKQIIGWSVSMFAVMFLYMILFPWVEDMAEIKMEAMPAELMQFFGMSDLSDMSSFVPYFGIIFNLCVIAISIFGAIYAAGILSREEKTKTIEFLYALEVSRMEIYVSKLMAAFVALMAVLISSLLSTVLCGFINGGETFDLMGVFSVVKITGSFTFLFMAIGLFLAGVSAKISSTTISAMMVLFSYILGFLGVILEDKAEFLRYFSPFEILSPTNAIAMETETLAWFLIYFAIAVVLVIAGGVTYNKRDYVI